MKHNFKAHPIMTLVLLKPFLFVLVIPVIRGIVQYFMHKRINDIFGTEIILLIIVAAFSFLSYRAFSVSVSQNKITIKKGFFFKSVSVISIKKLSSVSMSVSVIDALFGAVNCCINTEAGRKAKPDFEFKLKKKDAEKLSALIYGKEDRTEIRFSSIKIAVMAATTSSAITGLIIGVPVLNQAGKLLGIAISDMLFSEINAASSRLNTYFPPIVNAITILFIIAYGFSAAISFFKHINFRLLVGKNRIEIRSGFFVRKTTLFRKSCVNDIYISQTPLMRLFKLFSMEATVGGYGDSKSEKAVIVPCGGRHEIINYLKQYFPYYLHNSKYTLRAVRGKRSILRLTVLPRFIAFFVFIISLLLIILFPSFERFVLFSALVIITLSAYYTNLCFYNYNHGGISLGESVVAYGSKGLLSCELYCAPHKIGILKLIRTPADIKFGTCKLKITVRSENADSIRVRNIDYCLICESIEKSFDINSINS